MNKNPIYPFVAIVGQEKMKLALLLNIINPTLSGVLIRGEKGTATGHRGGQGLSVSASSRPSRRRVPGMRPRRMQP